MSDEKKVVVECPICGQQFDYTSENPSHALQIAKVMAMKHVEDYHSDRLFDVLVAVLAIPELTRGLVDMSRRSARSWTKFQESIRELRRP